MTAGSKEDAETVIAFFEDMKRRGLNDPLLVTADGTPGIIKAIEICFPREAWQRCLPHRVRNVAAKLPEDAGIAVDYDRKCDSAVACFIDDFEACIAHLRFHRYIEDSSPTMIAYRKGSDDLDDPPHIEYGAAL